MEDTFLLLSPYSLHGGKLRFGLQDGSFDPLEGGVHWTLGRTFLKYTVTDFDRMHLDMWRTPSYYSLHTPFMGASCGSDSRKVLLTPLKEGSNVCVR